MQDPHRLLYDVTPSISAVLNRSYPGLPYTVYVEPVRIAVLVVQYWKK